MKKFTLSFLCSVMLLMLTGIAVAQQQKTLPAKVHRCGTTEVMERLFLEHPERKIQYELEQKEFQKKYEAVLAQQKLDRLTNPLAKTNTIYTLPVVVHVINANPALITDAQIMSQLNVLNEDYSGTNADTANIPTAFKSVKANGSIRFCLAKQDPSGNFTTGIDRTTNAITFSTSSAHPSTVVPAWNTQKYLNIWVVDMGTSGVLGYSYLPGSWPAGSQNIGFVNDYRCFGVGGTSVAPFNKGRTATHEIGHYFNLEHIWGQTAGNTGNSASEGVCTDDDYVGDTPPQKTCNFGCPGAVVTDPCTTTAPGVMWMNYMDYVDDACMYMFTTGQDTRMTTALTTSPARVGLLTATGCNALAVNDASISAVISPATGGTTCNNPINPKITLTNYGSGTLTSVNIYRVLNSGAPVLALAWTGSLASATSTTITMPSVTLNTGSNTVQYYTALPNGNTDGITVNDSYSFTITYAAPPATTSLPLFEGFEGSAFPSTGWAIINPDNSTTWTKASVGKTGANSGTIQYYNYATAEAGIGQLDYLRSPLVNFSSATYDVASISFDYAYKLYSTVWTDSLEVVVSTDCGSSWTPVWKKGGKSGLATVAGITGNVSYTPTAADWTSTPVVVDLTAYRNTNLYIAMRGISGYGQNLYVDNMSISGVLPVILNYFKGYTKDRQTNQLEWSSSSEINTSSFVVEKSLNGTEFTEIGKVNARGNASSNIVYSFTDYKVVADVNYYRLKMVDKDGKFKYSNIISLKSKDKSNNVVSVYPNPVKNTLFVNIQSESYKKATIQVADIQGRVLSTQNIVLQTGNNSTSIDASNLPKGMYMLIVNGIDKQSIKFNKD